MYANFILTEDEPKPSGSDIHLGTFSNGVMVVHTYPAIVYFGGVIHLAFEEDDPVGVYEVELYGTDLLGHDAHVLAAWPLSLPSPSDGWNAPRTMTLTVPMRDICVMGDLDMALDVEVNRRWAARQTMLVRSLSLPQGV